MSATPAQIQQAIAAVLAKSAQDPAFRARALHEPVATLNETGGLDLPLNTPIRFVNQQEEILVPLPTFGADPDEITDEEMLASVSGGISPVAWGILIIAGTIIGTIQLTKD